MDPSQIAKMATDAIDPCEKTDKEKEEEAADRKAMLEKAKDDIVNVLCNHLYTDDGMNLKDEFIKLIVNAVNHALEGESQNMNAQIKDIILPPMTKYINDLVELTSGEGIDGFKARVLRKIFNEKNSIIRIVLKEALKDLPESSLNDVDTIIDEMNTAAMEQLKGAKPEEPVVSDDGNEEGDEGKSHNIEEEKDEKIDREELEEATIANADEKQAEATIANADKKQEEATIANAYEKQGGGSPTDQEKDPVQDLESCKKVVEKDEEESGIKEFKEEGKTVSAQTAEVSKEIMEDLKKTDNSISTAISGIDFAEAMIPRINIAFDAFFEKYKDRIYHELLEKTVQHHTDLFIQDNEIKLQLLCSILSADDKSHPFYIKAKSILQNTLGKLLEDTKTVDDIEKRKTQIADNFLKKLTDETRDIINGDGGNFVSETIKSFKGGRKSKKARKTRKSKTRKTRKSKTKKTRKSKNNLSHRK